MVATILLFGLVLAATVTDLARHKIYNWTTYTGILAALGLNAAGSLLLAGKWLDERQLQDYGWIPFSESFFGLLACGSVMLLCFVMFKVGGGDVKLIAMLGAFLGPQDGMVAMLWTFVLGACLGLAVLVWRVGPLHVVALLFRRVASLLPAMGWRRLGAAGELTPHERAQLQPPLFLAPCALAAVAIVRFGLMDWLM